MFLFLSKLLPLFLYPAGLSCLLLTLAVITFWKRPRIAAGALAIALGVLLFSSNYWVAEAFVKGLESQSRPLTTFPKTEAIVVLGGSTYSPFSPRVWPEVNESGDRLLYSARLYREGRAPKVILSGGRIMWQGPPIPPEAEDMKTLLAFMGVPVEAMLLDPTSLTTYENAVNTKAILEREKINGPILLVTSALHMPRSMAIFQKQGIQAIAAPTDYLFDKSPQNKGLAELILQCFPEAKNMHHTTIALKEQVGLLVYRLRGWA